MDELEDQLRQMLRPAGSRLADAFDPVRDGTAERIMGGLERSYRRKRRAQFGAVGAALVVAAGVAVGARGGSALMSSAPAHDTTASATAAPDDEAAVRALSTYLAAQQRWVHCLREHGVQVYGPDEHGDVSVDPDPTLRTKEQACVALQPALSDDVERQLQPRHAPGSQVETPLENPVTVTRSGTDTVSVGPAPAGATALHTELTCLSAGTFSYPDGASVQCSDADAARGDTTGGYTLSLPAGARTITITATDRSRWRLTAQWVRTGSVPYAVNAYGQTYGSGAGADVGPDLIAVEAGRGRTGYVYRDELAAASGDNETLADVQRRLQTGIDTRPKSIPMYESDGRTRIGTFHLG